MFAIRPCRVIAWFIFLEDIAINWEHFPSGPYSIQAGEGVSVVQRITAEVGSASSTKGPLIITAALSEAVKNKKGIINIAKLSQVPIVPMTWQSKSKMFLKFNSWDGFKLPLGFVKGFKSSEPF